jgi:hypothetical protein
MFDEKAKDRQGPTHSVSRKMSIFRSNADRPLLGSFQLRRACLNGCDVDHQSLQKTNNRSLL